MKAYLFERRESGKANGKVVILAEDLKEAVDDFVQRFPDPPAGDGVARRGLVCEEVPVFNGSAFAMG